MQKRKKEFQFKQTVIVRIKKKNKRKQINRRKKTDELDVFQFKREIPRHR